MLNVSSLKLNYSAGNFYLTEVKKDKLTVPSAEFISIKSFILSAKHSHLWEGNILRIFLINSENKFGDKVHKIP